MNMMIKAVIMGLVEGITEFLPISSTGHLIITGSILHFQGEMAKVFEIVIQLGAILAVVVMYWDRFWGLVRPRPEYKFSGWRGLYLLFLTSLPASIIGLIAEAKIKQYLFNPLCVSIALIIGGIMIFIVEGNKKNFKFFSLDEITPSLALGIGLFQCLALWPGFSRSAATIMGAMILGADRKLSAEYSFIAAVPIMFGATGLEVIKHPSLFINPSYMLIFSIGFIISFLSAYVAVKGFIHLLSKMTLRPFGAYRILLATLVLFLLRH